MYGGPTQEKHTQLLASLPILLHEIANSIKVEIPYKYLDILITPILHGSVFCFSKSENLGNPGTPLLVLHSCTVYGLLNYIQINNFKNNL